MEWLIRIPLIGVGLLSLRIFLDSLDFEVPAAFRAFVAFICMGCILGLVVLS